MATSVRLMDMKQELVVFLRNQDILTISERGVTTSQDTGTFAADNSHTLAVNPTFVKNVRNVNVDASDLTYGTDYTVNYGTGVISFTSPQTGAYIIDYDQGTNDKIYPDFPQPHLKLVNFPRIAVDIIAGTTTEVELGGGSNWSQYVVNISCYDRDQEDVENMIADIREAIIANKKSFYAFEFITPTAMGPILVSEFGQNKIFQRNQDCSILLVYED